MSRADDQNHDQKTYSGMPSFRKNIGKRADPNLGSPLRLPFPSLPIMSLRFKILGSSSKGNCALLITENCRVLIDAGFSAKRIGEMLEEAGESIDRLDAVFITHEHSDHIVGMRGLARYANLPVFANHATAQAVQRPLKRALKWQTFETGSHFRFRDLDVETFAIPHDAYDPVGFVFSHGEDDLFSPRQKVAWVTDLGYVPELVRQKIKDVDVLVVESNHCTQLLQQSDRPWSLKQRISGRHGHLSNTAARALLEGIEQPKWKQVYLAHLSGECNSLQAVQETFAFTRNGGVPYNLSIVQTGCDTPFLDL
jgi:phosphoribosyl 1,2-cyclic phosphodiesterase